MSKHIRAIQQALEDNGFDPGPIDGIWGRKTIAAVRAFQAKQGLKVDGVVGPITSRALFGPAAAAAPAGDGAGGPLVWYEEAERLVGVLEKRGAGSNRQILDWADDLDIHYPSDDIPWCGLFVAHCVGSTLPEEPLPSIPLLARAWRKAGQQCQPGLGAILVFWRGSPTGSSGHVGFYKGEDSNAYHVLGGNQSDSVCVTRIAKDRLLDARWPVTASSLKPRRVNLRADGTLSSNEQ